MRDRRAAGCDAAPLERDCDVGNVPVQTPLRDERAGDEARGEKPEGKPQKSPLQNQGDGADDAEKEQHRDNAGAAPRLRSGGFAIEQMLE